LRGGGTTLHHGLGICTTTASRCEELDIDFANVIIDVHDQVLDAKACDGRELAVARL
jgi:hypothetical protein